MKYSVGMKVINRNNNISLKIIRLPDLGHDCFRLENEDGMVIFRTQQELDQHFEIVSADRWVVWKMNGGVPTYLHDTVQKATSEAERLCNIHGGTFMVAKVLKSCTRQGVVWSDQPTEDEIPF